MLRYSLTTLFLILVYVCIGSAALANATGIWPQVAVTISVTILLMFTLAAICWKERARYFALGFSITGWTYFLLIFTSVLNVRSYLLTDTAVNLLFTAIHQDQPASNYQIVVQTVQTPNGMATTKMLRLPRNVTPPPAPTATLPSPSPYYYSARAAYTAPVTAPPTVDSVSFSNIGHSLWAVLLACIGGVVAQVLYARSKRRGTNESSGVQVGQD